MSVKNNGALLKGDREALNGDRDVKGRRKSNKG